MAKCLLGSTLLLLATLMIACDPKMRSAVQEPKQGEFQSWEHWRGLVPAPRGYGSVLRCRYVDLEKATAVYISVFQDSRMAPTHLPASSEGHSAGMIGYEQAKLVVTLYKIDAQERPIATQLNEMLDVRYFKYSSSRTGLSLTFVPQRNGKSNYFGAIKADEPVLRFERPVGEDSEHGNATAHDFPGLPSNVPVECLN